MGDSFPYNKDSIWLPDDFEAPAEQATTENFITLSMKLMYAEIACAFEHWREVEPVETEDGLVPAGTKNQEQIYRMIKHFESVNEGWRMVMERLVGCCERETTAQLIKEKAEEAHGIEFDVQDVVVNGEVVGLALKPKDPEVEFDQITTWLNGQARG